MNFLNERFKSLTLSKLRKFVSKAKGDFINMGLGEIRFPLNKNLKERILEILNTKKITYTPNSGLEVLKDLVKTQYGKSANVCITCGAEEAIFATLFSIISAGDEILMPNPTYLAYESIVKICGGKVKYFNLIANEKFKIDKLSLQNAISKKTKAIIFANPSNPLGIAFSNEEVKFIKKMANEHNLLIISDEIYRDLYLKEPIGTFYNDNQDNIVIISGISKAFAMAGWRVGWAVSANKELIKGITVAHQYIATCAPAISQFVAIELLQNKEDITKEIRKKLKESFEYLYNSLKNELPQTNFLNYDAAPYLFVSFEKDDLKTAEDLLSVGVLVVPGSFFGSNGKNWIRLNYALDSKELTLAKEKIVTYIKDNS